MIMEVLGGFYLLLLLSSSSWMNGAQATKIRLYNTCPFTIWPAWLPSDGHPQLGAGGCRLDSWQVMDVHASTRWSGKFWGRTNCQFDTVLGTGCCETGDCSGNLGCNSTFSPPATIVEFDLHHNNVLDHYRVSLLAGYNLEVRVTSSNLGCGVAGCSADLNSKCPPELIAWNPRGMAVGCSSPCVAFGADEFCCEKEHFGADKCHPSVFSVLFKSCCPAAATYPFDSWKSAWNCSAGSDYTITFCPSSSSSSSL
ncbi:thaumatin-like protein 1b [Selaginella moellendorffii]|nr:thaumatin-like protein 1b [Selaginella moellendorffii]|eukprot:XP_002967951.2 thaumatin-like protein 1b [Selaginella moellendorffii]